jgi:purine nucleosidase
MSKRRLVIDTDGGVDDAVALWWAATDPRIDLLGVTTVRGVVSADEAARNVLLVLEAAGRSDIPVAVGAEDRVGPAPDLRSAAFIHGTDGLGNMRGSTMPRGRPVDRDTIGFLDRMIARHGDTSIVSLGPLTNVARFVKAAPERTAQVGQLIVMGGVATGGGNALPNGEANIAHDPEAAAIVAAGPWRSPPLMVGLDVTHRATLEERDFGLLAEHRTPAAAYLDAPLRFYRRFGSTFTAPDCPCHDLVAVLALVEERLVTHAPVLPLAIATAPGPAWGSTIVDFRAPAFARLGGSGQSQPDGFFPWRVALDIDRPRFRTCVRALFGDPGAAED